MSDDHERPEEPLRPRKSRKRMDRIKKSEWAMISFTALTAAIALAGVLIANGQLDAMQKQLAEMQGAGAQSNRLIELQSQLNGTAGFQGARIDRLAINAGLQADYTRRLADISGDQLKSVQISAQSALNQVKMMEADQRPWLAIDIAAPRGIDNFDGSLAALLDIKVTNVGRSPAFNVQATGFGTLDFPGSPELWKDANANCDTLSEMRRDNMQRGSVLFPGESLHFEHIAAGFSKATIAKAAKLTDGQVQLFLYGCADYLFSNQNDHHQSGVIYRLLRLIPSKGMMGSSYSFNPTETVPPGLIQLERSPSSSWRTN